MTTVICGCGRDYLTLPLDGTHECPKPRGRVADGRPFAALDRLVAAAATVFGVTAAEITGVARSAPVARARGAVAYLAREHTDVTWERLAWYLGGRQPTGLHHVATNARLKVERDETFAAMVRTVAAAVEPTRSAAA